MTPTVVVIGAINVDLVVAADRLPGPGETVVGPGLQRFGGGKGANAAVAAARAGAKVRYVGAVGADDLGRGALDELRAEGIDVDAVSRHEEVTTGAAIIVVDAAGENQIAVGAGANGEVEPGAVRAAVRAANDAGVVLISTEIPDDAVRAGVETANDLGLQVILNPAPVLPVVVEAIGLGPLLTPNAGELADLARALGLSEQEPTAAARAVAERTGAPVIVTLGGDGVLVVADHHDRLLPGRPVAVRDTTGAGDTFNGVLAARLAAGDDLEAAAGLANHAAGISVGSVGARPGMPTAELLNQIDQPAR